MRHAVSCRSDQSVWWQPPIGGSHWCRSKVGNPLAEARHPSQVLAGRRNHADRPKSWHYRSSTEGFVDRGAANGRSRMSLARAQARASLKSWAASLVGDLSCNAIPDPIVASTRSSGATSAWMRRRQRPASAAMAEYNFFTCRQCNADVVGTWSGPLLCSMCRAERCS